MPKLCTQQNNMISCHPQDFTLHGRLHSWKCNSVTNVHQMLINILRSLFVPSWGVFQVTMLNPMH